MTNPGLPGSGFAFSSIETLRKRRGRKWSLHGSEVVPAWIADADVDICPPVDRALRALLDRGDVTYPIEDITTPVAEAFVARMADRYGWHPDPSGVVLVADLVQAVSLAIDHLSVPGDGVMLQTPCYPPFLQEIAALERVVIPSPWRRTADGWEPDLDQIAEHAARSPGSVFVLVNPHNPTGRVWTTDELEALAQLVADYELIVISDEIHAEFTHTDTGESGRGTGEHQHIPFAMIDPVVAERTITLTSTSKSFNLPGLRCAVMHLGSGVALEPIRRVRATQIGQISNMGQLATLTAWAEGHDWLEDFRSAVGERRDQAVYLLAELLPEVLWVPPQATYLAWLDCRGLAVGDDPAQFFLDRARVALSPGHEFGPGGAGHVRINLATSASILGEIFERMVTAVDISRG